MTVRVIHVDIVIDSNDWDQPGADSDQFASDVVTDHLQRSGTIDLGPYNVRGVELFRPGTANTGMIGGMLVDLGQRSTKRINILNIPPSAGS